MRDILRRFKPEKLSDLTALNALYRPGPIRSGMIDDFIKRKHGKVPVKYELPELKDVLEDTLGVIVYQEQVMQIASELAGFSLGEADILRKAMGKKKVDVMQVQREKFIEGAKNNKVPEKKAAKDIRSHGAFRRIRIQSLSLSRLCASWRTKPHTSRPTIPCYFMAALLTSEKTNTDKIVQYMRACRDMGIEVLPPDINESSLDFSVVRRKDPIRTGRDQERGRIRHSVHPRGTTKAGSIPIRAGYL